VPWDSDRLPADERADFVEAALVCGCSFARLCRDFHIAPKTGYKWLRRATEGSHRPLGDRSRRPHTCPARTPPEVAQAILQVHDDYGWGARKVRAFLLQRGRPTPSLGAVHHVLRRGHRVRAVPPPAPPAPPLRFQRSAPNHLWQMDFKGPLGRAARPRYLLTVEDDCSRYLLALGLCADQTMASAWGVLWAAFAAAGLPDAILSDNGFAPRGPSAGGLSWLEARLWRLGVQAIHGRPYHPQTQGKVERLHRTLEDEVLPRLDWEQSDAAVAGQLERWRVEVYNAIRPHEALGQAVPQSRWYASDRARPGRLPEVSYPVGMATRKVMQRGEISWQGYELMVGAGLTGERVGVQLCGTDVVLLYGTRELRRVPHEQLVKGLIV
jgi:transposase InsO family protein